MMDLTRRALVGAFAVVVLALGAGCTMLGDLAQIGEAPPLTRIQNPKASPNYRKVSMPMPRQTPRPRESNSLWRPGARAFFKDQRAAKVGDIVTVNIDIADSAKFNSKTTRERKGSEAAQAQGLAGYENRLKLFLPKGVNPTALINASSTGTSEGTGKIDRDETVKLKVAAVVTQILPNGNLVVHGRQEMRVNYEIRELQVAGVIRRADITSANTIDFDKIAEARIAYGGRGHITRSQSPRFGQQLFDIMFPF
jgi:flagellar L-ring protein precursor FlgH